MKEVYVSNVPYAATEEQLKDFLESKTEPGAVRHCELRRESFQPRHKGFGFVTFSDEELAERVQLLASIPYQLNFQGRSLRINVSKRQVKQNPGHSIIRLQGNALSMGCLTDDTFHVLWSTHKNVECEFDFRERKFELKVTVDNEKAYPEYEGYVLHRTDYKLEFRFRYIDDSCLARRAGSSSKGPMLLFELWHPPHVFRQGVGSIEVIFSQMGLGPTNGKPWVRSIDFTEERSIGQSFAYLLEFGESQPLADISNVRKCLEDYRLASSDTRLLQLKTSTAYADPSPKCLVPLIKCPDRFHITFRLMFKLNYLVQVGNLSGPSLSTKFLQLLYQTPEEEALWVLQNLEHTITMCTNPEEWLEEELTKIRMGCVRLPRSASIELDDGLVWVYRVMVTPTKIYCTGREAEVSNRVTRAYMHLIDNFIRVSFNEEDHSTLGSQALSSSENIRGQSGVYRRILRILREGICLHGKLFEFLAFSSSQLREQSFWMFARINNVTANSIREWMGDFLDIRNVAKCAARMGQCFSSTTNTLPVELWEVEQIDDINTADGKYCFSDGIGKISSSFAKRVATKCGCRGLVPSAFQIRYGGFKGVVAVSHDLLLHKLSLRNSMKKFESDHFDLEVIRWTKRLPCYLNRQIITLLSTLGIEDYVFEVLQDQVLSKLNKVVMDVSVALDILQMTSSGATHQVTIQMLKAGYTPKSEPYLRSLLQAFRAFQLLMLRTKSRILVPKGRTLTGCLDETGILEYGQVFLRVSSFPGTRIFIDDGLQYEDDGKCVLEGPVVVAKNPCLHPGDVRVLEAVDVPQLHHMVDCVVFPQRGCRPHPNECSGSDLDGDEYFVTWDELLIPLGTDEPMDYDPPERIELSRPVTILDIQDFFCEYMKSDALGLIANAHVVQADKEPDMARHPKCLELAKLFSMAVDFPKTGIPAVMGADLRPSTYPDFMEKEDKISYVSQRVIGSLFRAVVGEAKEKNLISTITRDVIVKSFDKDLIWHGFEFYIPEATMLKSWYDAKLLGIMNQYEIKTEAEVLSSNILPLSKFYVKKQHEVKDRIGYAVRSLQSEARGWFKHGPEGTSNLHSAESNTPLLEEREAFAKASAWYHVTYHPAYLPNHSSAGRKKHRAQTTFSELSELLSLDSDKEEGRSIYLLSFPWVVHDTLLAVKKRNRRLR